MATEDAGEEQVPTNDQSIRGRRVCGERPGVCLGIFDPVYCFDMGKRVKESHSVQALHIRHL